MAIASSFADLSLENFKWQVAQYVFDFVVVALRDLTGLCDDELHPTSGWRSGGQCDHFIADCDGDGDDHQARA